MIQVNDLTKLFYPALSFSDILRFKFRQKIPLKALDNISFNLEKGKILGILGENGAGKTTLLKILSTLILPDSGSVLINDYRIGHYDQKIKSLIGLVSSSERSFYWRLSGWQNLEFFAALYGLDTIKARARITELLHQFKINYAHKRFDSYSTGMKRNFSLIRSLLHNPEILLFDEPTKSLDFTTAEKLRRFMQELKEKGKSILFATHDIKEAEDICDEFLLLDKGKLLASGTKTELEKTLKSKDMSLTDIYRKFIQYDT